MQEFVKCFKCEADRYPNQLERVRTPSGTIHMLCTACMAALNGTLADKEIVGKMMAGEMTLRERKRLARERGRGYARSDFEMGVWA